MTAPLPAGTAPASAVPNAPAATADAGNPAPQQQTAGGKEPVVEAKPDASVKATEGTGEAVPTKNAPESYTFKASEEGLQVGDGVAAAMTDVFRELDLTQDAAQKIVDKVSPALRAQTQANIKAMVEGWERDLQADPTIGGKLPETLALAEKALAIGSPELRQLLGSTADGGTGLGRHKAVVQWLAEIGRRLTPDTKVVPGGNPAPVTLSDPVARLAATYDKP